MIFDLWYAQLLVSFGRMTWLTHHVNTTEPLCPPPLAATATGAAKRGLGQPSIHSTGNIAAAGLNRLRSKRIRVRGPRTSCVMFEGGQKIRRSETGTRRFASSTNLKITQPNNRGTPTGSCGVHAEQRGRPLVACWKKNTDAKQPRAWHGVS